MGQTVTYTGTATWSVAVQKHIQEWIAEVDSTKTKYLYTWSAQKSDGCIIDSETLAKYGKTLPDDVYSETQPDDINDSYTVTVTRDDGAISNTINWFGSDDDVYGNYTIEGNGYDADGLSTLYSNFRIVYDDSHQFNVTINSITVGSQTDIYVGGQASFYFSANKTTEDSGESETINGTASVFFSNVNVYNFPSDFDTTTLVASGLKMKIDSEQLAYNDYTNCALIVTNARSTVSFNYVAMTDGMPIETYEWKRSGTVYDDCDYPTDEATAGSITTTESSEYYSYSSTGSSFADATLQYTEYDPDDSIRSAELNTLAYEQGYQCLTDVAFAEADPVVTTELYYEVELPDDEDPDQALSGCLFCKRSDITDESALVSKILDIFPDAKIEFGKYKELNDPDTEYMCVRDSGVKASELTDNKYTIEY